MTYCEIFNECFPMFKMSEERFAELLYREEVSVLDCYEENQLVGFAAVADFAIRLICVLPACQGKGYGTGLLNQAQDFIASKGYTEVITGGVSSRFFIGATSDSWGFFEKNGFAKIGECDEMLMKLSAYKYDAAKYHGHTEATFGWYEGDMGKLHKAVAEVAEDWVQYFTDQKRVFVGMVGDEIASFCLVDKDTRNYLSDSFGRVGMPGCVGTVPGFRNRGIALEMIALATEYLKNSGMDISFIFYTGVADWYRKAGYEIFLTEYFGKKNL